MRALVSFAIAAALCGCADILGIQDRYYEGGAADGAVVDAPSDAPATGCTPCTSNGASCEVIACHQDTPTAIAVSGSTVYWANSSVAGSSNAVMSAPVTGGNATSVLPVGGSEIPMLVTFNGDVYASTFTGGTIVKVSTGTPVASAPNVYSIATDPVSGAFGYSTYQTSGSVFYCGTPTGCTSGLQIANNQPNVQGTAIDAKNMYWSSTGGIYTCSSGAPCAPPPLLVASPSATLVAVDDTWVYWVDDNFTAATIWRALKADGSNKLGLASAPSSILSFVIDGGYLYYAAIGQAGANGKVVRIKTDGTGSTDLATGLRSAAGVAVDATHVYFTEWGPFLEGGVGTDGRVMRVPR